MISTGMNEKLPAGAAESARKVNRDMNRRISRWLYRKATQALGEEELESLKNDLLTPVKIAVKDAVDDMLSDNNKEEEEE